MLIKIFQPAFFAREDTKTPLRFAAVSILVNIAASIILFQFIGYVGIAVGTVLAAWTNVGQLATRLWKQGDFAPDASLARVLPLTVMAALGMGVALWFGRAALEAPLAAALPVALATLLGLIAGGILVYFFLCQITGAARLSDLRRAMRRG